MKETKETPYKSFVFLFFLTINATLGSFIQGYKMGEMNMAQINMKYIYNWSPEHEPLYMGTMTSFLLLGNVIGALFAGAYLFDRFSRIKNMILADILIVFATIFMVVEGRSGAPQIIGRLICGVAGGINCAVVPTYINEISPTKIRGELGSYFNTDLLFGIFLSSVISIGIPTEENLKKGEKSEFWRFLFVFPAIFAILRLIFLRFYFNYESPLYLLRRNQENQAILTIKRIYKEEFQEGILQEYKQFVVKSPEKSMSYVELLKSKYKDRVFIGIKMFVIQALVGINAVIYYSATIFGGPNTTEFLLKMFMVLSMLSLMVSSYIAGFIVDKYGRKILLLFGVVACMIENFAEFFLISIYDEENPNEIISFLIKSFIIAIFFTYGLTLSPVTWIFTAEILNDKGMSVCGMTAWSMNFLLGILFPFAVASPFIRIQGTFLIFAIAMLWGYYYIKIHVKETYGKTAEEIDVLFENGKQMQINEGNLDQELIEIKGLN